MRNGGESGARRALAEKVAEYIDLHFSEKITLAALREAFHFNENYISYTFKEFTGTGVNCYITKKRMEKAKSLLENTSKRAYEVAEEVGFSDPHYFSVSFKKATGKTPTEYAKESRNR